MTTIKIKDLDLKYRYILERLCNYKDLNEMSLDELSDSWRYYEGEGCPKYGYYTYSFEFWTSDFKEVRDGLSKKVYFDEDKYKDTGELALYIDNKYYYDNNSIATAICELLLVTGQITWCEPVELRFVNHGKKFKASPYFKKHTPNIIKELLEK